MRYQEAEKKVFRHLLNELDEQLCYHDLKHTVDVIRAAERLAYLEQLKPRDTVLVKTGALFHDIGFCEQYIDNEETGAEIAGEMLPDFGFSPIEVDRVQRMILATRIPQAPHDLPEAIVCDADLDYLGRADFVPLANNLKRELIRYNIVQNDEEWHEIQIKFLSAHQYFTPSAQKLRNAEKEKHLEQLQQKERQILR